ERGGADHVECGHGGRGRDQPRAPRLIEVADRMNQEAAEQALRHLVSLLGAASRKKKVAPPSGSASAVMSPPLRWRMRRTLRSPRPWPSNSSSRCRRWNGENRLPALAGSKPTPLSRTK